MFSSLGPNNVNIRAIAQGSSERNIPIIINENDTKKALNNLHEYFEKYIKTLNLFIIGMEMLVQLIEQIQKQKIFRKITIKDKKYAIANSKNFC